MRTNYRRYSALTTWILVGILLLAACAAALGLKEMADRAARNEATVLRTLSEVRLQDSLEWQAISGRGDGDLDVRHSVSVAHARSLLGAATLDEATQTRLLAEQATYADVVQEEFRLLAAGLEDEAEAWDETHVDPAADTLLEDLDAVAARMGSANRSASFWTGVGLVGTLLLALSMMGLIQRRRFTDRARQQQELRSEARYRAIIDRTSAMVLVCDSSGEESYRSPAAERVLGEASSNPRSTLLDALEADDQDRLRELLVDAEQAGEAGEAGPVDLLLSRGCAAEGAKVYQFTARDLTGDPAVGGIVLSGQDVTQSRELTQAKSDFLANVSHELRTPLTSMGMYLELLLVGEFGPLHDRLRAPLTAVERNGRRLHLLVEELLFVSGFRSSPPESERERVDLVQIVTDVVADARMTQPTRRIDVDLTAADEQVLITGIHDELERVVTNLVGNALKFSPGGEAVTIALTACGEMAELVVRDSGIGIPLEEQHRLFERFFRSRLARHEAIPGTGLGLAVCKAVVEAHDGSISVDSEVGRGTSVVVRLPAVVDHLTPTPGQRV